MKKLVIPVHRSAYSVDGCDGAITVRDLIERLEDYDEDTQIYFSHDNTCCDTVLNVWHTDKCTEIECRAGGDLIMFRVYGDEKEGFSYTSR